PWRSATAMLGLAASTSTAPSIRVASQRKSRTVDVPSNHSRLSGWITRAARPLAGDDGPGSITPWTASTGAGRTSSARALKRRSVVIGSSLVLTGSPVIIFEPLQSLLDCADQVGHREGRALSGGGGNSGEGRRKACPATPYRASSGQDGIATGEFAGRFGHRASLTPRASEAGRAGTAASSSRIALPAMEAEVSRRTG